ncbi:MAG TPA: DJ-1/PfpI family protein [Acetobacteraceae bacterium]|nr:DJ-1/PfpI family protein [Acetobacteraceae bacterium]
MGIVIGPGFIPMDMVGIQAVFGLMPGAEVYLVWKSLESVEGFPDWWTIPTATFSDCPELDVVAVPMLPPEIQNDREVIDFVAVSGAKARYVIGICNCVLVLGAAGLLNGRRATASYNSLSILPLHGVAEVVSGGGVVADRGVYTAGPGIGSFDAALLVAAQEFGRPAGELAELMIEYDPHPPFGTGSATDADPALIAQFEGIMADMVSYYRAGASSQG